eukprot:COSAG02_NODE_3077_length_7420_cov_2.080453_2_plen_399_part_00
MSAPVVEQPGGQRLTVDDPECDRAELPPRLRPGTSTVIEGVKVLTSEGAIEKGSDEHERLLDELLFGNGFFIAKGVLPPEMCADARNKLLERGETFPLDGGGGKRLHNIIEDDVVFSELVIETHRRVGDMLEAVMGNGHYLGSYHALTQYRSESRSEPEIDQLLAQGAGAHSDFPGHQGTAGHLDGLEPYTVQTIWMMEDFSQANGGTRVLPSSHLKRHRPDDDDDRREFAEQSISAVGEAGDLLVYIGQVWHASGFNLTDVPRVAILGQWLPRYFAPMEHMNTIVTPQTLRSMPAAAKLLLGMDKRKTSNEWSRGRGLVGSIGYTAETVREGLLHGLGPEQPAIERKAPPLKLLAASLPVCAVLAATGGTLGVAAAGVGALAGAVLGAAASAERARL